MVHFASVAYQRSIFIEVLLLLALCIYRGNSISCFRCDSLETQKSDCPGWNRPVVHSVTHLGDKNGFYTHCLDVRLADNTIIHQDVIPFRPTCRPDFMKIWKSSLESQFKTNITITCCGYNGCNGHEMIISSAKTKGTNFTEMVLFLFWIIYFTSHCK